MPTISVKITNLPQIKAAFGRAPRLVREEMNEAIKRAALTISADSRRNTPVATGRLRSSTYERFSSNMYGEVGTNTTYDRFVHDGTRFMKSRPYLQLAVDQNQTETERLFTKALQNVLDKIGAAV
jgi:HK97 gp10 family phage protein